MMKDICQGEKLSAVIDNNILVDLFELGEIPLLFQIFDKVIIPFNVLNHEVAADVKALLTKHPYIVGHIYTEEGLTTYQRLTTETEFRNLSDHDRLTIAIAKEVDYYCGSNDKPVRKACDKLNVKCTGILGVLGRAYFQNVITEAELDKHLLFLASAESTCFIKDEIIEEFINEISVLRINNSHGC